MHTTAWTGGDLIFNAELHEYRLPLDGRIVPNVTSILRATGMSTDFEAIKAQSAARAERIDYRRDLGTAVHADCHAFDDDDLVWDSINPDVLPYLEAWAVFRENTKLTPTQRERRVFHPLYYYCGTLDGIFLLPNGLRVLGDIKIGDPEDAAADLQTAAYAAAHLVEHPHEPIDERWSIQLTPDKGIPYRITNYTARPEAWQDFAKFQACLTVFAEQQRRRNRR
jgi:hypothetical protein